MGRADLEDRVRAICMAFPGVAERLSHGAPAFFAGKQFVMLWPDGAEVAAVCEDAFRTVAAKKLVAELDRTGS